MNKIDSDPLVSIIIPAYNAEAFIAETLYSVLSQTYKNIEVLVVDDGSCDRTCEIVKSIAQKDTRVILLQQANSGVAAARNLAIQTSRGEYIAPIDADDIWYPQKLEKQVQCFLEADESVGLVYAWSVSIDQESKILWNPKYKLDYVNYVEGDVYTALVYSNFIGNASVPLIRRECLERVGGYNCKLKVQNAQGCEDWDLSLRIAEFYQFKVVPEFLIGYRQVIGSMGSNCRTMERSYDIVMAEVKQRHPEISNSIYKWGRSNFYEYLINKSSTGGAEFNTLVYIIKLLGVDRASLMRTSLYRLFIRACFELSIKTIINQFNLLSQFCLQVNQPRLTDQVLTIAEINEQIKPPHLPWKPYDKIRWHRASEVVRTCKIAL